MDYFNSRSHTQEHSLQRSASICVKPRVFSPQISSSTHSTASLPVKMFAQNHLDTQLNSPIRKHQISPAKKGRSRAGQSTALPSRFCRFPQELPHSTLWHQSCYPEIPPQSPGCLPVSGHGHSTWPGVSLDSSSRPRVGKVKF